jgi:predicted acylesterase/phospholipase RssA
MSPYRILSLDGGGIRGVLTAKLLERLEMAHPGFLSKVDLLAGTSTGGILALGLAVGLAPEEIGRLYEESGTKVFANSLWDDIRDLGMLIGSDYSNEPLKQALLELMGEITLGDLQKRVLVSSFDLDNDPQEPVRCELGNPSSSTIFPAKTRTPTKRWWMSLCAPVPPLPSSLFTRVTLMAASWRTTPACVLWPRHYTRRRVGKN